MKRIEVGTEEVGTSPKTKAKKILFSKKIGNWGFLRSGGVAGTRIYKNFLESFEKTFENEIIFECVNFFLECFFKFLSK